MTLRPVLGGTLLLIATVGGATAQGLTDQIVSQLHGQGFSQIEVSRTWLGRVRIEASGQGIDREIVLNPRTGEILRDFWTDEENDTVTALAPARSSGRSSTSDDSSGGASDQTTASSSGDTGSTGGSDDHDSDAQGTSGAGTTDAGSSDDGSDNGNSGDNSSSEDSGSDDSDSDSGNDGSDDNSDD